MADYRRNGHSVSSLSCHIVWATKYRYHVLKGDLKHRCRDLLIQVCDSENVQILKGVVSKDHIHMHIVGSPLEVRSGKSIRMSKAEFSKLQQEMQTYQMEKYPELFNSVVDYGSKKKLPRLTRNSR